MTMFWTQAQAIALCWQIEQIAPAHGLHVALTGGTLYKAGERKDVDIMLYRIRQVDKPDWAGLWEALARIGIERTTRHGWVQKALYRDMAIDFFNPEHVDSKRSIETGRY
jgi:hypothetical protein